MKTIFSIICTFVLSTFLVTVAFATDNCSGDTCMDNPSPPTPPSTFDLNILVESFGGIAGIGQVNGIGDEFAGRVDKESSLVLDTKLTYASDLCEVDCGAGSLTFDGSAFESIKTIGAAISTTPGEEVAVGNASSAQSLLGVKLNIGGTPADDDNGG
jgi:hypothetical protein